MKNKSKFQVPRESKYLFIEERRMNSKYKEHMKNPEYPPVLLYKVVSDPV